MISSFTHPQVAPNTIIFFSIEHKKDILKNVSNQTVAGSY